MLLLVMPVACERYSEKVSSSPIGRGSTVTPVG